MNLAHPVQIASRELRQHVDDAGSRADAEDRYDPGPLELGVELELPAGDVEEASQVEVVGSGRESAAHRGEVQTIGQRGDHHGPSVERAPGARRIADVTLDR